MIKIIYCSPTPFSLFLVKKEEKIIYSLFEHWPIIIIIIIIIIQTVYKNIV